MELALQLGHEATSRWRGHIEARIGNNKNSCNHAFSEENIKKEKDVNYEQ